jgi:Peptidyl-prolyl cis-trans isomerase (rotamase) - cyclophilin family
MVEIEMMDGGIIKLELYPAIAPETVENFITLAKDGFYDGLIFHRVIEGFMIQGGDPLGTGAGGSDKKIKGEFKVNGVENNISHVRGVISMARQPDPYFNSASSQFFIVHKDAKFLDGNYAAFGKVTEGLDIVDTIATTQTNRSDKPTTDQKIKTIRVTE